jgi:outer membrane protein TolC
MKRKRATNPTKAGSCARRRWVVAALPALLLAPLGCGPEGDWRRELLRPQPEAIRAVAADEQDGPGTGVRLARLLPPAEPVPPPPRPGPAALPAVLPPTREQPIDLAEALRRAGVANPTIALAWEAVRAGRAEQLRADALLLPTLHAGASFNLHRGELQSSRGILFDVSRQSLYAGAGAGAVGAGTVTTPGVWLTGQLAEAWYEPKAARERVAGREFDALAARNNVLLEVTGRYLALAGAGARLRALRKSEAELAEVARVTAAFVRAQQGRQGDADRARAELLLLQAQEARAQEAVAVAAAELARLLDLDPSVRPRPADEAIPLLELVNPHEDLAKLVQTAVDNRPEVGARTADVALGATLLREEQVRPFAPFVAVGLSAGDFGGGSDLADSRFGHVSPRVDFDVLAVWSLDNLGLGNLAVQRRRRAEVAEAEALRARVIDQIRREVAQAQALALAHRRQLDIAARRVRLAQEAYQLDFLRTRNLKGYPIELLDSLHLLTAARLDLVAALVEYDQAQFQLFVALGQPPTAARGQ